MKTHFAAASLALGLIAAPSFASGGSSTAGGPIHSIDREILNHSVVVGVEKLMNEQHDNRCVSPSSSHDITWLCLGAIPPVTEPTITPSSCYFSVTVKCPGEAATISGSTTSYFLNVPQGNNINATPTDQMIVINEVSFAAGN